MMNKLKLKIPVFIVIALLAVSGCSPQLAPVTIDQLTENRNNFDQKRKNKTESTGDVLIRQEADIANEDLYVSGYEDVTEDTAVYLHEETKREQLHDQRYKSHNKHHTYQYRLKSAKRYGFRFRHSRSGRITGFHYPVILHHSARLHHLLRSGVHTTAGFGHRHQPHPGFVF